MSQLTHKERENSSLFAPIVLIAIGLFFLFSNLNWIQLHWSDLFRLWPLLLVFLGLNILAQQTPRPYAVWLSGLVSVLAVLVFGYILIFGVAGTPLGRLWQGGAGEWQTQAVAFSAQGVESAVFDIEIGPPGATLYALEDSRNLVEGNITYLDEYLFDSQVTNGEAMVKLAPHGSGDWMIGGEDLGSSDNAPLWRLGLNPQVPTSLSLSASAGSSTIDLRQFVLQSLSLKTNAGEVEVWLPDGNYDASFETNAASGTVTLPKNGRHTIAVQVNAGSMILDLPAGIAAHVMVDQTFGDVTINDARLQPVSGGEDEWQTADFDGATDWLDLQLHISMGSVTIR